MAITPSVFVIETYIWNIWPSAWTEVLRESKPLSISKQINQIWQALCGKKYPKKLSFTRDVIEIGASWWCADTRRTLFVRLVELLETIAGRSRTTNTWTYNLVKTVIIIMNFSHEGREGNWVLHLINADNAVSLGHRAMENVKGGRPDSTYILPSRLASCHNGCEEEPHVSLQERVYDKELIYARVIGLLASSREINLNDMSASELVACSPSILNED